ncbi:hypothetical protein BC332_23111 [Capsicum chinense]|nr:hypothetical protein BC332_23111 [Capsicum chinense]
MFFYLTTLCLQRFTSEDSREVPKKDFKNYLQHKHKEMTVEDLIVQLRIEEDNKAGERRSKGNSAINGAHIGEDGQNNSKKKKKVEQGSNQPKKKFKGKCFNCECNLVGNPHEWWMDSGATRHVCSNKELFSSFTLAQVEEMIYMANSATAKVEGTGKVCLKMTSGKVLTLNNVLYVPKLCRNLISVSLLDKNRFKCVIISGKIVISNGEMYVGNGYLTEGLYKIQAAIGWAKSITYNVKSCHIRWRPNTVWELLSSGIITIDYVKSKDIMSDPLTKGLFGEGVERTSKGMGLRPRTSQHGSNST